MRLPLASIFAFLILLPSHALAATTQPSPDEKQMKLAAQAELIADMKDKPFIGEKDISEIIHFDLHDGRLIPSTPLPVMQPSYVKLKGTGGYAKVQVISRETIHTSDPEHYLQQFAYRDTSVPGNVEIRTEVDFNYMQLSVTRWVQYLNDGMLSIQFIETSAPGPEAVVLYIQNVTDAAPPSQRRLAEPTFSDLYLKHAADVNTYLRPVFRTLRQEQIVFRPDDHWAYQALQQFFPADTTLPPELESVVKRLDADSFADRQAALRRLHELGDTAATDLMRHPLTNLTPEQKARVDSFLAPFHPLSEDQANALRGDKDFLLDCQFSSDALLRRVAAEQLQRIGGESIRPTTQPDSPEKADALVELRPRH
jgi:hypothetical protein